MTSTFKKIFENAVNKVLKEADENFVSVASTADNFDVMKGNIETEALPEDKQEEKNKLTAKAVEKIKDTLKVSDELQSILNQIKKINNDTDYNEWKANEEDNTATLRSKNARIFKQNDNLCLSHSGEVELFKSVPELHAWLKKNNYPLPHNIILRESIMKEGFGDVIPADEIITPHTNTSELFRMELAFKDSPWANILKHRWENVGTSRGKILGYAFGLNDLANGSESGIKEIELEDGRKAYIDLSKIDTNTNKAVPIYSTPELKIQVGAYRPDDESITTLTVNDNSYIDKDNFYNTHKDKYKMGKDATKTAMDQAGYKQVASQTNAVRDTNLGAFNSPEYSKIIDKVGLDRAEKYIGDVSDDGTQCLDINGEVAGIVRDKKVYDKDHPDIQIGKVGLNGYCFKESDLEENQLENVWYLEYKNDDAEQYYLNDKWKIENLLTNSLDSAAKFSSRENAIDELKQLYTIKSTPFPFKPLAVNEMEECGCGAAGVTSAALGPAVQYVGNPKKKEESADDEEEFDEAKRDAYNKGRSDIHKNYLIGAPAYNKKGEIIGYVTDRATARNDVTLNGNEDLTIAIDDAGNVLGKTVKQKPLVKSLEGDTLGYADGNLFLGEKNHIIGKIIDNTAYDSKGKKAGVVSEEVTEIIGDSRGYPIGYAEDGEVFSFKDEKIGDVKDIEGFEGSNFSERNYVVQDADGNDIGYTTLQGYVKNFNGNYIGKVNMVDQAQKAAASYDDLSDIVKDRKVQGVQSDFAAYALGKKPFSPYNKKGELKPDYLDTINPGNYTSDNLFGQLFDLNSQEVNALLVDKDTFIKRINDVNKMHGVNFDPEQPIYPRSASKGTANQQAWDQLQQNFMNDVALRKGRRGINAMTDVDKDTWNTQSAEKISNLENAEALINKSKDVLNKALADYDEGKVSTAYNAILNHLQTVKNNENIPAPLKNTIYKSFLNSGIDGIPEMINFMFKQNESMDEEVLTEDDPVPADFADGGAQDTSLSDVTSSETTTQQTTVDTPDSIDDYGPEDDNNTPASFGDININADVPADNEEQAPAPTKNEKIIDVLANEKDMSEIKVKVKDLDTGKVEIKNLNEIDV